MNVSLKFDYLDNREVTSSKSRYYVGRYGKSLTTSQALSTKIPNKKQKARIAMTDITKQDFTNWLKYFNSSPYLGYKSKQGHNEPTEYYFLLINHVFKLIKSRSTFDYVLKELNWTLIEKNTPTKKLDMSTK